MRRVARFQASECDWLGAVFHSKDLGPLVIAELDAIEDVVSYARACAALRGATKGLLNQARRLTTSSDAKRSASMSCLEGNARMLDFHRRRGVEIDERCADAAITGGHLEILQHLHDRTAYALGARDMDWAAHRGQLPALAWMHAVGVQWDERALMSAARAGHAECLKFILATGRILKEGAAGAHGSCIDLDPDAIGPKYTEALEEAAGKGHLDCVQLLREAHGDVALSLRAANKACGGGHLQLLEWMWPQMQERHANASACALEGDHVECFRFVYEKMRDRFTHDDLGHAVFDAAVLLGRPKCLGFLLGQGFQLSAENRQTIATRPVNTECLRAVAANGGAWTAADLTRVALSVDYDAVTVLAEELGVPWEPDLLEKLTIHGPDSERMFRHCLELGATAQDDLALTICMCGHAGMLEHYLATRNPVLDDVEMQACVTKNLPECARVLVKHHHGQKDRLERFAHRVYDHAVSSRLRHKRAPFMEMAFGA